MPRRISLIEIEGIEIAPGPAGSCRSQRAKYPRPEGSICKGASRRRRNRARSLVQRETNHAPSVLFSLALLREKRKARAAIILGCEAAQDESSQAESSQVKSAELKPSRVEEPHELSFAHLQTNWANGVKITGARDALSPVELVLSAGHGSRGDGKIAGTKLAWLHREQRGTLSQVRVQVRACVRACTAWV